MKRLYLFLIFFAATLAFAGPDGNRDKLRSLQQQEAVRSGEVTNSEAQELRQREDSLRKQRWQNRQENLAPKESPDSDKWRKQWKNGPRSAND